MEYNKYNALSRKLMILASNHTDHVAEALHQGAAAIEELCTLHKVASDKAAILTDILYRERAEHNMSLTDLSNP